jgi:crotonobetainyl-CoA:carnitine CoA-transferase CaiB-like acyl-CoA transferase
MWQRLCTAIEAPQLGDAALRPEYATDPLRSTNRDALNRELSAIFSAKPTSYWLARLRELGVPCGPVLKPEQVFDNEQVQHLGIAAKVQHPERGEVKVIRQGARLSRTPDKIVFSLPALGLHTREVLQDLGYTSEAIIAFEEQHII